MNRKYNKIWKLALPYLKKGEIKDFVLHTKSVVKAAEFILKKEKADKDIVIVASIVHDTGWAGVPLSLQRSKNKKDKERALKLHISNASDIIKKILANTRYNKKEIKRIVEIVIAHKSSPRKLEKKLLIDADTLSDAFREQFYSDAKSYGRAPVDFYRIRIKNNFYTKTAQHIFDKEMRKRAKELKIKI
jgi:hypothetical protein